MRRRALFVGYAWPVAALVALCLISACAPLALQATPDNRAQGRVAIVPEETIKLWPDGMINVPVGLANEEVVYRTNSFGLVDRAVHNVHTPILDVFKPKRANRGAILIIPGGGYSWVVMDKEGYEGARYFAARGYMVYVLRYRLPHQGWNTGPDTPLIDARQAIQIMRARADQDGFDPNQIMSMGFSAGGHVAGSLASRFEQASARPNLSVLMYPVATMQRPFAHPKSRENLLGTTPQDDLVARYSLETNPNPQTPPTFILHAADDPAVPIENATMLFGALRAAKVPVALHVFEKGGHGFGMRGIAGTPLAAWPDLVLDWAVSHGFPAPFEASQP